MEDPNSDDWPPPGWTVELRVRKNGQRDKYYFAPSSGLKFNSKVEVSRHLDNAQNKVSTQRIANNVVVEKGIAEGLPPGWMKKTKITTKGETTGGDSYYIDPISGYAFCPMKDVDRYLESGEIGRNAFKPKYKDSNDMEFEDDKFSSAGVTLKPTLSVNMGQSSNVNVMANNQQIPKPACVGEYMPMPITEHISSVVGSELTSSVLLQAEGSDQKEGKVGLAESALLPGCTVEDSQGNQLQENSLTKHGTENALNRQRKCKKKEEINLPRRASKRLAGIKVDPVPELKMRTRTRQVAFKQPGEGEAIPNEDKSPNSFSNGRAKQFNALEGGSETNCKSDSATNTMESPKSDHSKPFYGKLSAAEKLPEKTVEGHGSDKDQECFSFLPKVDSKLDYSLEFPLNEILTDPCIAFAIQTLTGVTLETSRNSQSKHSESLAAAEGLGEKGCNVFSPPGNIAIPEDHAANAEIDNRANENTGSSSEKPLDISWMDPCIEFAIKTLTGTIPIDSDQKPMFKKESFVDPMPTLQDTRNVGIGNSGGAKMPHCDEDRRNVCHR